MCSGCAVLSFFVNSISAQKVQVIPIDFAGNKHQPKVPITKIDLTQSNQVDIVIQLIRSGQVLAAHFAPPCGTCSRAREIFIPGGPRPLRNDSYPLGIPDLEGIDKLRVDQANAVYNSIFVIITELVAVNALITIENPDRSLFWNLPSSVDLLKTNMFTDTVFQHCKYTLHRAMRPKWVRIRSNFKSVNILEGPCHLQHNHLSWGKTGDGKFATSTEAEYPAELASKLALLFLAEIEERGYQVLDGFNAPSPAPAKRIRAATTKQPRGKAIPQLIPEFKDVIYCLRSEAEANGHKILRNIVPTDLVLARGQQIEAVGTISSTDSPENIVAPSPTDKVAAGVFHTPEEFTGKALKLDHPADTFLKESLPPVLVKAIVGIFNKTVDSSAIDLVKAVRELVKLSKDNEAEDNTIFVNMESNVKTVLRGKKLFTLKSLLQRFNYQDTTVVDDLSAGFALAGMQPYSQSFEHVVKLPTATIDDIRSRADLNNKLNLLKVKSSGDHKLDKEFYEQAMEEMKKGWLIGPFSNIEDYVKVLGHHPNLSRRFPLQQSDKVRSIDDMLESGSNTAYGCQDKLMLHDVDCICAIIRTLETIHAGSRRITDNTGAVWTIDSGKRSFDNWNWEGKTIDLSEAYKQCATHPDSMWLSAITIYNPATSKPEIFGQRTLPFGASGSVLAFNRVSRALWFTGCAFLGIIWGNFFDDYPTLSPNQLSKQFSTAALIMLKILGFKVSDKPGKDKPWSQLFVALGVTFDVEKLPLSLSTVRNKPERVASVVSILEECMATKHASLKVCDSVRGKLVYMEAQIFGRVGRSKLPVFGRTCTTGRSFSASDLEVLEWIKLWLANSKPRNITSLFCFPPLLLYTDGACEPTSFDKEGERSLVTMGAVLLDRRDKLALFFGCNVGMKLVDEWRSITGKKQLVTEAEMLPQLLARHLWKERFTGAKVICFVDSEPAKHALIRGSSDVKTCADIAAAVAMADSELQSWIWYSRVPSVSNLADGPSRLHLDLQVSGFKAVLCNPIQPDSLVGGKWFQAEQCLK